MAGVKRSLAAMMGHDEAAVAPAPLSLPLPLPLPLTRHASAMASCLDAASTAPSPPFSPALCGLSGFSADASIALVGVRGAGKSTLAIMASAALRKNIIDMETAFHRAAGCSSSAYKKQKGAADCQRRQAAVLDDVFRQNPSGCILVCSWMERRVQSLLQQFASTNPVVHVLRSARAIQDHLKIVDFEKARNLVNMSSCFFRTCTNLEFFNISATQGGADPALGRCSQDMPQGALPPYLALKKAERDFFKFLSLVYPAGTIPFLESASPLACIAPEDRCFTYALSVDMAGVLSGSAELEASITGVDAVQILVDGLAERELARGTDAFSKAANQVTEAVGIVRRSTMLPIILHVKLPEAASGSLVRWYLDLVAHGLCLAPEMVTVDLRLDSPDIAALVAAKRRSKVIADYCAHTAGPSWDSASWVSWYEKGRDLGCDMVRLVQPATHIEDNFGVARLRSAIASLGDARIPLTAYNSGPLGRHSACFNPVLTLVSPTPAARASTPLPCLTATEATRALYASFVFDAMKLYVFGANVGYSMSPAMHNAALAACGIPHRYETYSAVSLSRVKHLIQDVHFGGASVGLPFKVEVITLTHSLSPHAQAIGAVNTLIPVRQLSQDGSVPTGAALLRGVNRAGPIQALYGENTDWIGIRACIRRGLSPANAVRPATTCGLVVGAGGMARAAVYAMLQTGVQNIAIYNRTAANAEKLASHFRQLLGKKGFELLGGSGAARFRTLRSLAEPWPGELRLPSIIISCIPTHPIGGDTACPDFRVPEPWLGNPTGGVVIELGYKTLDTPLLTQARRHAARGWVAMDGLDLLPEQGFAQFELFTGRRAPCRAMRREVLENYTDQQGRSNLAELGHRLESIYEQVS